MVNKVIICIQARLCSTRLKGKILFNFFNKSVIDRIINVAKKVKFKKKIVILSGNYKQNYFLKKYAEKNKIDIFFGNEHDVLARFKKYINKNKLKSSLILRLTSDNYLAQPKIIDHVISSCIKKDYEYCYIKPLSHFAGELVKASVLLNEKSKSKIVRNHVTIGIRKNKKVRKLALSQNTMKIDHSRYFTLDTLEDLKVMKVLEIKYPSLQKIDCLKTLRLIQKENKNFKKLI